MTMNSLLIPFLENVLLRRFQNKNRGLIINQNTVGRSCVDILFASEFIFKIDNTEHYTYTRENRESSNVEEKNK